MIADTTMMRGSFWKKWTPLFGAGLVGVAAITAASIPSLSATLARVPDAARLPLPALLAISVAQSAVLLGVSVAVGVLTAPRLGLRSLIVEKAEQGRSLLPRLRPQLPLAVGAGAIASILTVGLDLGLRPWMPPMKETGAQTAEMLSHTSVPGVLAALLYGGITEELLLRWGLMSLLAWLGWKLAQRERGLPNADIMWTAILLSSLLFGLGHLPVTSALFPLTPLVIARAVLLNGIGGIVFGWLFWRRSLESAMVAHASAHVVLTIVNLAATLTA